MSALQSGDLKIRTAGDKLVFYVKGEKTTCAIIDSEDLPVIVSFLNAYISSQSDRRRSFRVYMENLSHDIASMINVTVESSGNTVAVTPINISVTGIYVKSLEVALEPGSHVHINLNFDGDVIVLPAVVIRQEQPHTNTAFQFINDFSSSSFKPPTKLKSIFRTIESHWLSNSLDLEWMDQPPEQTNIFHDSSCGSKNEKLMEAYS